MRIETKFNLGDNVVAIASMAATRKVLCGTCQQTGKVKIQDDEFICPRCHGKCLREEVCGDKWFIAEESIVGKIDTEHTTPSEYSSCWDKEPFKIRYMIRSTGIGSGQTWPEINLFATRELAIAECDLRNSGLVFKNDELDSESLKSPK